MKTASLLVVGGTARITPMTLFSPSDRDSRLERAIELLMADRRVEAAVITGSIGAGRADRWSDFDLGAVLADGVDVELFAAEWDALAYREWPVAHHYATAFGSTLVRGYMLRNGLLGDFAFTPIADFTTWAPVRVVFDRSDRATTAASKPEAWSPTPDWKGEAGFAAHDVLHAAVAARRNRPVAAAVFPRQDQEPHARPGVGAKRRGYRGRSAF